MNLLQILCHVSTFGKHVPEHSHIECLCELNHDRSDRHCEFCEYYLFTEYNFPKSLKKMRNDWKMWWETKE
jgi:hypothetical protein